MEVSAIIMHAIEKTKVINANKDGGKLTYTSSVEMEASLPTTEIIVGVPLPSK